MADNGTSARSGTSTLLLIEDDTDVALLLAELLRAGGRHVTVADSLTRGLESLADRWPDAILCDLNLAGNESGLALPARMGALAALGPMPRLIALSAYRESSAEASAARAAGFDAFVCKSRGVVGIEDALRALLTA